MGTQIDTPTLRTLLGSIHERYGYDFREYAEASLKRRFAHFMEPRKITSLAKLGDMLLSDEHIFEEFVEGLSVTVTEMFRDPAFYRSMRENVMRRLATYPVIKVWVAGCATGEEAYSIAILLKEEGLLERSIIYATDINQRSLQQAKEGVYGLELMKDYTRNYQEGGGQREFSTYYKAKYNSAMFNKELRENIVFSVHNLSTDSSFNEFQLIVCRNVLIYFNQRLQDKVIGLFYDSLCNFGYLALGNKESLLFSKRKAAFEEIDRREKIFMKKGKPGYY